MKLARAKDETDLQFRARLSHAKAIGEGRDVINPWRQQHDSFEAGTVKVGTRSERVMRKTVQIVKMQKELRINDSELKALLLYKQAWDMCDRSPSKDSCDMSVSGGDGDGLAYLDARMRLQKLQAVTRAVCKLDMFEAIVCHDKSPTKTAQEFFGYANGDNMAIVMRNFERGVMQVKAYFN